MNRISLLVLVPLICLCLGSNHPSHANNPTLPPAQSAKQTAAPTQAPALSSSWQLAWSDEFEGTTLDTTKWAVRDSDGNEGNGELEYYDPYSVTVSGGYLTITATKNTSNGKSYNSGWLDSHNLFFNTYGRYEFSARMPGTSSTGYGLWPAIWLLSQETCWPEGSEFDIMEYRGAYPTEANGYYHYAKASSACGGSELSTGQTATADYNFCDGFHVFALEWFPGNATWYIDSQAIWTQQVNQLGSGIGWDPAPHYIIFNFAVGGPYPGNPKSSTVFPAVFLIDYARFYVYRDSCTSSSCSGHGCCNPSTFLCTCDAGWAGSSCEYFSGSLVNKFTSTNTQFTPATDLPVNGWGNSYALYLAANVQISKGLTLTLTNKNCPSQCGNLPYSAGGWTSAQFYSYGTYSFYAKSTAVSGTGFTFGGSAAGPVQQQIYFDLSGAFPTSVTFVTFVNGEQFVLGESALGFDASAGYHNYSFVYSASSIAFAVDGNVLYTTTDLEEIPPPPLALDAYYTAEPQWFGGTFTYSAPSTVSITQATWLTATIPAPCPAR